MAGCALESAGLEYISEGSAEYLWWVVLLLEL